MLDAMHVMEWCPALRSAVLCRLAKAKGVMVRDYTSKHPTNPKRWKEQEDAFKSAAFHLILPFMAYFKGVCLTTIDCSEHSLLKMVGY
ncbi:unnamed protein product [Ectocarpus sp. CCAP 1310/34]|nr:unnamed protein product [Ectocarpus sp. CCAP 1310/34]